MALRRQIDHHIGVSDNRSAGVEGGDISNRQRNATARQRIGQVPLVRRIGKLVQDVDVAIGKALHEMIDHVRPDEASPSRNNKSGHCAALSGSVGQCICEHPRCHRKPKNPLAISCFENRRPEARDAAAPTLSAYH